MRRSILFMALALGGFAAPTLAAEPAGIQGNWITADGKAVIRVAPCGEAMCGRIVELPSIDPGERAKDSRNPDPAKRGRGLIGLRVFWALVPSERRFEGKGYSPERGRYFDAEIWRDGDRLRVKGCVALICQTQTLGPA